MKWVCLFQIVSIGSMAAAAAASTGVAILLETDVEFCKAYPYRPLVQPVQGFSDSSIHGMVLHGCICLFHILAACFSVV
jgi:hypothetical protein